MVTMCKVLADLLGVDDPLFSVGVHQLELASGQPNVDVRLYAEIISKSHQKLRELGLDPKDTTGEELYNALLALIKRHDEFLGKRIGLSSGANTEEVLQNIQKFTEKLDVQKTTWALKPSVAKRLLKATPPKKLMKLLKYRSVDSMLKREDIGELYIGLRFVESEQWLQSFTKKYKQLSPSDFELRSIKITYLDEKRWGDPAKLFVKKQHHNVTHMKEMGVIALLPLPFKQRQGICIAVLPLMLHYVNEIRMYSTFFRLQQVRADFGDVLVTTLNYDPKNHIKAAGHDVHWRTVQRHLGSSGVRQHPETFEPYVQAEDLYWRKAEEVLYRVEPALHFWNDMDYVASKAGGGIVSFNLMDMAVNYANGIPYGKHFIGHFRAALWNEIFVRYIGQPALEYQVIKQLANQAHVVSDPALEELFI